MIDQKPRRPRRPGSRRDPLQGKRPAAERIPQRKRADHEQPTRTYDPTDVQDRPAAEMVKGQPPEQPKQRRSTRKREPLSVPWWGFLLMILVVGGATCGLWAYVLSLRDDPSLADIGPSPTPIFVVITATPTLDSGTGAGLGGDPLGPTATLGAGGDVTVPAIPPTSTSAPQNLEVAIGSNVRISGTGGDGLSIRQGPGTNYGIFAIGQDGDVFVVEDGPREANGFTWWYIVDPADEDRAGWAVQQFMSVEP